MNKEIFEHLLDDSEEIVKVLKPNKKAYYLNRSFIAAFLIIFSAIFFSFFGVAAGAFNNMGFTLVPVFAIFALIVASLLAIYLIPLGYKNTWFAYTNKRLIIRKGIINIQYQTLELKLVGVIDVNESFIDRYVNQKTGNINFSSPSNPTTHTGRQQGFVFEAITDHYEVYKELKNLIDNEKK